MKLKRLALVNLLFFRHKRNINLRNFYARILITKFAMKKIANEVLAVQES